MSYADWVQKRKEEKEKQGTSNDSGIKTFYASKSISDKSGNSRRQGSTGTQRSASAPNYADSGGGSDSFTARKASSYQDWTRSTGGTGDEVRKNGAQGGNGGAAVSGSGGGRSGRELDEMDRLKQRYQGLSLEETDIIQSIHNGDASGNRRLSQVRSEMEDLEQQMAELDAELSKRYNKKDFGDHVSYGSERALAGLLGVGENITDFIGSGVYKLLEGATSLGGLAPNGVSQWAGDAADAFLDNSVTRDYEESIRERYNPSKAQETATGIGQMVTQMLIPSGASTKIASALNKGAGIINAAANANKAANIGRGLFGAMAAGSAANEARQEGADTTQALVHGATSGLMEMTIEGLAGGIPGLGKSKLAQIVKKVVDNPVVSKTVDILGEGGEEWLSTFISPFIKRAIYDSDAQLATPEELAESAMLGILGAGVLQGLIVLPTAISNAVSDRNVSDERIGKIFSSMGGDVVQAVVEEGLAADPASKRYRLAEKLKGKLDNAETLTEREIGQLYRQNVVEIEKEQRAEEAAAKTDISGYGEHGQQAYAEAVEKSGLSAAQVQKYFQTPYQMGLASQERSSLKLGDTLQEAAYNAGRMDAALHPGENALADQIKTEYTDITKNERMGALRNGTAEAAEVYLRDGSQRAGSAYPGRAVFPVGKSAGGNQSRQTQGRPADGGTASLTYGGPVSTASLGISGGKADKNLRLVTGGDTAYTRQARQIAKERGLRLTLFGGGNLQIRQKDGSVASVRAYISGDRVFVRVDHPLFTSSQLMRHEAGHHMLATGEIDPKQVRKRIRQMFGRGKTKQLAGMYAQAYDGTGLTAKEIWEEIICDSLADMNIFAGTVAENPAAELLDQAKKQAAESQTKKTRGPPMEAGAASRDLGERNRALRKGEMVNAFRDKINWRKYYQKILSGEYNPDYFDDGAISLMELDGSLLTLQMQQNGEWSLISMEEIENGNLEPDRKKDSGKDGSTEFPRERENDGYLGDPESAGQRDSGKRSGNAAGRAADRQRSDKSGAEVFEINGKASREHIARINAIETEVKNRESRADTGRETIDRWADDVQSSYRADNWHLADAQNGATAARNDALDGRAQRGGRDGAHSESGRDLRSVKGDAHRQSTKNRRSLVEVDGGARISGQRERDRGGNGEAGKASRDLDERNRALRNGEFSVARIQEAGYEIDANNRKRNAGIYAGERMAGQRAGDHDRGNRSGKGRESRSGKGVGDPAHRQNTERGSESGTADVSGGIKGVTPRHSRELGGIGGAQITQEEKLGSAQQVSHRLTEKETAALLAYKSGGSYQLNAKLREGMELSVLEQQIVDGLDTALPKLPAHKGTLYRNIGFDGFGDQEARDTFVAQHSEGMLVTYSSYTSASTDTDGYPVEGDYVVHMVIEGETGRDLSGYGNNSESEVLFERRKKFRVTKLTYDGSGTPTIYMTEVDINGETDRSGETDAGDHSGRVPRGAGEGNSPGGNQPDLQPVRETGARSGMQPVPERNPQFDPVQGAGLQSVPAEVKSQYSRELPVLDERFYAPRQVADARESYETATQRVTRANRDAVQQARADIVMYAHNQGAAETLGITQAELNKKVYQWAKCNARAREMSQRFNVGVEDRNRWTGIENSNLLNKATVSNEDLDRLVGTITGDSTGFQRKYIMRVMLALDTHIDYSRLNFMFAEDASPALGTVNGWYRDDKCIIIVRHDAPCAVAHEMGHYLDFQWARDVGVPGALTEYQDGDQMVDPEVRQWLAEFSHFNAELREVADLSSRYSANSKEIFARFVDYFVNWVNATANGEKLADTFTYTDEFTSRLCGEFVQLLQKKAALDEKRQNRALPTPERVFHGAVNQSMTMSQAKKLLQRAFIWYSVREWFDGKYRNGDEWLDGEGTKAVALVIESDDMFYRKYLGKIQGIAGGTFQTEDILHAYVTGALPGQGRTRKRDRSEMQPRHAKRALNSVIDPMEQMRAVLEHAFLMYEAEEGNSGKYQNADDWLAEEGARAVAEVIDGEWVIHERYLNPIRKNSFRTEDILNAYAAGTLADQQRWGPTKRLDISAGSTMLDERFYAPKQAAAARKTYETAMQRVTRTNRDAVKKARADIVMYAHNQGAAETLGLTQAQLNRRVCQWAGYNARARETAQWLNEDVADWNRWTGIENSNLLSKATVSNSDLDRVVGTISGDSSGAQRKYIMRVMLALDTHIDYTGLNFEFVEPSRTKRGRYSDETRTIRVRPGEPHTVAHEMGRYLLFQWARDAGLDGALTDWIDMDYDFGRSSIRDPDMRQWVINFDNFIYMLRNVVGWESQNMGGNEAVFAQFVNHFVYWVEATANGERFGDIFHYDEKFTREHYLEFVRLLQEKAALDGRKARSGIAALETE